MCRLLPSACQQLNPPSHLIKSRTTVFFQMPSVSASFVKIGFTLELKSTLSVSCYIFCPIFVTFGIADLPEMLFRGSVYAFRINWSCERRILINGFNEYFPYFLHILPHLEVVRYGKCTKIFSYFQLHKNGAQIDINSSAKHLSLFTLHIYFARLGSSAGFNRLFTLAMLGSLCLCHPLVQLS